MAIDDPVEIAIRQADEAITDESYLPKRLVMCGLSAALAAELAAMPAVSGIVLSLFKFGSVRFERRLLVVAEELNAQQKRIEASIPDRKYYESEEFQSLIGLVIEKLNTTHDEEKLRMFGDALANAGSSGYQPDEKEDYIRILRDLSNKDLQVLKHSRLNGGRFFHDAQSSVGRLVGITAVQDRTGLWRGCLKVKALAARERSFHIEVSFFTGGSLSKSRESESKLLRLGQYRRRPERIIQPLV